MELLNYTGKKIGITNEYGEPVKVLNINGSARLERTKLTEYITIGQTPIYDMDLGTVRGLPNPDPNFEKLFIVTKQVAEASANIRFDLVVPEQPFIYEGATFYRQLIRA